MEKRNRYRNPVRPAALLRVIFFCLMIGVIGGAFVFIRNRHVTQGDAIHSVEMKIAELDHDIQMWELRVAGAKDRIELARRLKWIGSDLEPIEPKRILKIKVQPENLERDVVIVQ